MLKRVCILIIIMFLSCKKDHKNKVVLSKTKDNVELLRLYEEDQLDRKASPINWDILLKRDSIRLIKVFELLNSKKVKTSLDYKNAAMIFQHGTDTIVSLMAIKMMRKSIELDSMANKWLLAAAIDRELMRRKKPQIYGTQYVEKDSSFVLYEIDTAKITDEERIEYNVTTLTQQKEKIKSIKREL